jgi:hypothetical protein
VIDLIGGKTILPKQTVAFEDRLFNLVVRAAIRAARFGPERYNSGQ